jgi:hypothetical protein
MYILILGSTYLYVYLDVNISNISVHKDISSYKYIFISIYINMFQSKGSSCESIHNDGGGQNLKGPSGLCLKCLYICKYIFIDIYKCMHVCLKDANIYAYL